MRDGLPERDNEGATPAEQGGTTAAAAKKSNGQELEMTANKGKENQDSRGQAEGEQDQARPRRPRRKHKQRNKLVFANHSTTGTLASGTLGPGSGCHKADGFLWACKLVPPPHPLIITSTGRGGTTGRLTTSLSLRGTSRLTRRMSFFHVIGRIRES